MMFRLRQILLSLVPILLLIACDQPQQSQTSVATQDITQTGDPFVVTGVSSKGPIRGADINVFAMDTNGNRTGPSLATTTTDNNGFWSVSITPAPASILLVESSGGSYVDEADPEPNPANKRTITLGAGDIIEGVLFPGNSTTSITLLTDALLEKSRLESTSTDIQTVLFNNRNNAVSGLGFDPFGVAATDPVAPSSSASDDSIEYAMFLGGVANALNSAAIILGKPVPDFAMMMALVQDLSDGRLNGLDSSGIVTLLVDNAQRNFPDTLDLNQAILRFRNNNFQAYAATSVSSPVNVNETALAQPGTNTFPIASDDIATTAVDTSININNALGNDSDADGDSLTVSAFSQPSNGSVTSPSNGLFVYTPNTGFSGSDAFTYTVDDARGGTDSASIIINVQQTVSNLAPVAFAGNNFSVLEQTPVNVNGSGQDADGTVDVFSWTQDSGPAVTLNSTTTALTGFTAPDVNTVETIVLTLTVTDNQGLTGTSSVSITINPVSVPPIANAGIDSPVDEQSTVNLTGSATADTGRTISTFSWQQVSGTSVTLNSANTANPDFTTPVVLLGNLDVLVFQLTATDDVGASGFDFVTVLVNPVLIPPTANAGVDQTLNELSPVSLSGSGTDDGSISSFTWVQVPAAGAPTVTLSDPNIANPTFTAPDVANNTTLTFQLTVTDDEGGTATDSVNINLLSLNAGPTLVDDPNNNTAEDTPLVLNTLRNNDTDPENNLPITINSVTQPANGTVVIEANNLDVTYTPNPNFNGTDTFTYTAQDSLLANSTNSATVTVTVSGVNDNPVANTDSDSVVQGFPLTISNLTANDTDPENDTLSITGVTQPANGVSVNNGDGTVTYTPDLAFNGADSFTYSIVDGNGGSAVGVVNITVIADSDGDGVIDSQELVDGTDPNNADSDSDTFFDGHEKVVGTNPNLNTEVPPTTIISSALGNHIISADTTWGLAQSPFWLQSDVNIQNGATLTIEPGVIVKSNANVDFLVNNGGALNAQGNAAVPQHVVFTSSLDDTINGDTTGNGSATQPSDNDWAGIDFQSGSINGVIRHAAVKYGATCVDISNSSPVIDNVEIGDCGSYGILMNVFSSTHSANLSSVSFFDYDNDANGVSTLNSSVRIVSGFSGNTTLNINNLVINDTGTSTGNDHGLDIVASSGNITGTLSNITVVNPAADGINILNSSSGTVNIDLSNLSVDGSTANSIDVRNTSTGTVITTFDGINAFTNNVATSTAIYFQNNNPDFLTTGSTSVNSAGYGLQLDNSAGSFRNFTLDNTAIAGVRLQNASAPAVFSNIVLTNAATPYELVGQNLTPVITAGYDFSDATVAKNFIRILGTFPADMTLTPDPLNIGGTGPVSVWRVPSNITIPAGVTLTIEDGAVVKFDLSRTLFLSGGTLNIGDGLAGGANAILTSIRDDSVGVDLGDPTGPAAGNWNYIQLNAGASINIDNAIIRYMNRGIYHPSTAITSFTVTNSEFREFNTYGMDLTTSGAITYNLDNVIVSNTNTSINNSDGIRVANSGGPRAINLQFNDVTVDRVGNDVNNDRGIEIFLDSNSTLTGSLTNITVANTFGTGIILQNTTGGLVNPTFSGLNITNPGSSRYGLQLIGNNDGQTQPTVDGSTAVNLIGDASAGSAGVFGMLVQGVAGTYNNITVNNATSSALYISGTTNPLAWDDATIILNNSPAPWRVLTNFPASIGTLGTSDLGYNRALSSAVENYLEIASTIGDTLLVADPLGTTNSVWHVPSSITVPSGSTLTVNDGAVLKFALNTILNVTGGSLVVGDGNGAGTDALFTSIRDDSLEAGGDTNGDGTATAAAVNDWNYIQLNNNSVINMDNATIRFMNRGIYQPSTSSNGFNVNNTNITNFREIGMDLTAGNDVTYIINNVSITNGTFNDGIRVANSGTRTITVDFDDVTIDNIGNDTNDRGIEFFINSNSSLTGRLDNISVSNTADTGILLQNTTEGLVNPVFSGLTITDPGDFCLQLIGTGTTQTAPIIDDSLAVGATTNFLGNANAGSGGIYALLLQGVSGSYSHITTNNTTSSSLFLSGDNTISLPADWDATTIVLNNSPSPWTLRSDMPANIGILGTINPGFTPGAGLTQNYVQTNSTLSDLTIVADPLGTGSTVWHVNSALTLPSGATLTVNNGAVMKFASNLIFTVDGGTLNLGDGVVGGSNILLTSILDDSVEAGGNTGGTGAAINDWSYIQLNNNSTLNMDDTTIRFMNRGIYQPSTSLTSFSITNSTITDFREYGLDITAGNNITYTVNGLTVRNGAFNDGIRMANSGTRIIDVDFDNVTIDNIGNDANDRGIEVFLTSNSQFTGRFDNITVSNTFDSAILLQNTTSGSVTPAFSGINIMMDPLNTNAAGAHGVQLIGLGDGFTAPTFDGVSGTSIIGDPLTAGSGGGLGLTFQGVDGTYSDIEIHSTSLSALYFSNNANPVFLENPPGTPTIILDNSPSPYTLVGMNLPAQVPFDASGAGLVNDYVRLNGSLLGNLTLNADPLATGSSFYRVVADLDVTSGNTLTINAGTLLKFDEFFELSVLSGGTLDVNGTSGNEVIMTSFSDPTDGTGSVASADPLLIIDWEGLLFNQGSLGTVDFLTIWYARDGVEVANSGAGLTFNNLTVNYAQEGVLLNAASSAVSPSFNNLAINENSARHLYLIGSNAMTPSFSGNLSITDVLGNNATAGIRVDSSDNTSLSGFTVTGSTYGLRLRNSTSAVVQNNVFRQSAINGVRAESNGAPIVRNNIIVGNGTGGGDHGGIYTSGSNAFINSNLIRNNRGAWGVGIYVNSGSPVIQNNLIVENFDVVADVWGGSGILVFSAASPTILNNTIANNTSTTVSDGVGASGAGLAFQSYTGTANVTDNILFGNTDGNSNANDFYIRATTGTVTENFNLVGPGPGAHNGGLDTHNLGVSLGANDLVDDPDFTDGWYLSSLAAVPPQLVESPARDAGSVLAGNTANGAGTVVLTATTTRTDGVNEGAGSTVDLGYHYPGGTSAPVVSAALSTVSPATHDETGNAGGTVVTITVTPRDGTNVDIGAGLVVVASATDTSNLSSVIDQGEGSYQVTYTIPSGAGGDTVSFTANGQSITANTVITWTP